MDKVIKDFMENWSWKREKSVEIRRLYDETFKEVDNFMRGNQWNDVLKKKPWMSTPVNNTSHLIRNVKVAEISETDLSIKVKPLSDKDIEITESVSKLLQSYWDHTVDKGVLKDVKQDSRSFPIGYLSIKFDGSAITGTENNIEKGGFRFESLKPTNVFWDHKAFNEDQADFMFVTRDVSLSQLKNTKSYDQKVIKTIIKEAHNIKSGDGRTTESGEVLDRAYEYSDDFETVRVYEISFRYKVSAGSDYKYGSIHTASMQSIGEDDDKYIEPLWYNKDLGTKSHYIIPLREYNFSHDFIGRSTVQLTLDKQKEINKIDATISNIASNMQNVQKIISADSGIDPSAIAKYGNAPGLVIVTNTDINNSYKNIEPVKIPTELIAYKKDCKSDIYEVANITPAALGQGAGSLTTSAGVNSLISQSSYVDVIPKDNYRNFIKKTIMLMFQLIIKNQKKITRRIDSKDPEDTYEYEFLSLETKQLKNLAFDLTIDIMMTEQEKQRKKQEVIQLLSIQGSLGQEIISPEMAVKLLDLPDSDLIINNMHGKKNDTTNDVMLQVATQAAMMMAQEIHDQQDEDVDMHALAQTAAVEAVKMTQEQGSQDNAQEPQGASGAGAVQPNQINANLGQ